MKNLILTTTLAMTLALPAVATPFNANNQNQGQAQGQAQGQLQGQAQGQSQTSRNTNRNANANNNSNGVNVEGSASASVGAASCTNGLSIGAPGAAIGFSLSDRDCKIVAEAQMLKSLGLLDEAATHLTNISRVQNTIRAVNAARQPVASTRAAAPVTRPVARPAAYTICERRDGKIAVGVRSGATQAQAVDACRAALR